MNMNNAKQIVTSRVVETLAIDKLTPYDKNPFHLYEGERLEDMVESVRENGILVPIIVRRLNSDFIILAGHNRVQAAKRAGFIEIPSIVLEDITDDEAMVIIVESNLL